MILYTVRIAGTSRPLDVETSLDEARKSYKRHYNDLSADPAKTCKAFGHPDDETVRLSLCMEIVEELTKKQMAIKAIGGDDISKQVEMAYDIIEA